MVFLLFLFLLFNFLFYSFTYFWSYTIISAYFLCLHFLYNWWILLYLQHLFCCVQYSVSVFFIFFTLSAFAVSICFSFFIWHFHCYSVLSIAWFPFYFLLLQLHASVYLSLQTNYYLTFFSYCFVTILQLYQIGLGLHAKIYYNYLYAPLYKTYLRF